MRTVWIGIAIGDTTGIGPEVTLKALATAVADNSTRFVLIGNSDHLRDLNRRLGLRLPLLPFRNTQNHGRFFVLDPHPASFPAGLPPGAPIAARAAIECLTVGAQLCLRQELDALVTAPVNKESIIRSGQPFVGQTEYLSQLAGAKHTAMMLLGTDDRGRWLRVVLATTHLPLRQVPRQLTRAKVELAIELAAQACRDLDLGRARIGVCGLNPHAGEGGKMGNEEITVIGPAVRAAQQKRFDAVGPLAADSLFHQAYRGDYDIVVAMYHDQGLAPLKMIAFESGINWTLGLPFVRTSPDHGTAYDIAGQDKASPASMLAAIQLAIRLRRNRPAPAPIQIH